MDKTLLVALMTNNAKMVQRIVRANPSAVLHEDSHRWTPLFFATERGNADLVRWLLDKGANVRAVCRQQHSALSVAAQEGFTDIAHILLDAGADVNERDANFRTPLMYAVKTGHRDTVRLLLERGADTGIVSVYGETAMSLALSCPSPDAVIVKFLRQMR